MALPLQSYTSGVMVIGMENGISGPNSNSDWGCYVHYYFGKGMNISLQEENHSTIFPKKSHGNFSIKEGKAGESYDFPNPEMVLKVTMMNEEI